MMKPRTVNLTASASLILLIVLCLTWELWLAPLRPGGSWLVLKALPLLAPLFGILHARRYTHQWCAFLALAYFVEGVVRVGSDTGYAQWLAGGEVFLALTLFTACLLFARASRR